MSSTKHSHDISLWQRTGNWRVAGVSWLFGRSGAGLSVPELGDRSNICLREFCNGNLKIFAQQDTGILVNGQVIEPDFDIFNAAGNAARRAVVKDYVIKGDSDRALISFEPLAGKAILSGIELLP